MKTTKILSLDDLIEKVRKLQKAGKKVVQSHGIFDVIHPGIIAHLDSAKKQGDVLIVTVIKDKDVKRGPGRPIFHEDLRAQNVSSLRQADYVCVVDDEVPFECVKRIKPSIFAKGQSIKERSEDIRVKVFEEERELYFGKTKIYETNGFTHSSMDVVKNFLNIYPEETQVFLERFAKKHSFGEIEKKLNSLSGMKILLIGDGIIDEYHYCEAMNRSAKAHLVVNRYMSHEVFAGGAFAIANHISGLCSNVHVISLIGGEESKEEFIRNNLKPNVEAKLFLRDDGPTIVKKRYIDQYLNQKLFEINYLNDMFVDNKLEADVIAYLKSKIPDYDLVLVSDFGHGFITKKMIRAIVDSSKFYAVNTQTNGANAGYNLVTKYHKPNFVCLDEVEVRLATQEKFADIEELATELMGQIKADYLIITRGKKGSLGIDSRLRKNRTPIFSSRVVDTVGAGDAFFSFTAPCIAAGMPLDLVSFIGNVVGALAVQIMGNKRPVEKYEMLEFINALLK